VSHPSPWYRRRLQKFGERSQLSLRLSMTFRDPVPRNIQTVATACEIAYKRDPTRNAVHIIDHTREFRTLVGSRFACDVTPPYCAFS
jgi:hypothetical protein